MSVYGITGSDGSQTMTSAVKSQILGKDDFFKLLITELKYQDPLEPMKDREFIAQMASFSALEQMYNMNTNLQNLSSVLNSHVSTLTNNLSWERALALIGKEIEFETSSGEGNGVVESVVLEDGVPHLMVKGDKISLEQVTSVRVSCSAASQEPATSQSLPGEDEVE